MHLRATLFQEVGKTGLRLGIVRGDRVVHLAGFGQADPTGRPVTPHTPMLTASITKSFTAMSVMQLVEAGKVELDAPIQRYLPWFRVADADTSAGMTVRHLLNQTSGFPTFPANAGLVAPRGTPYALTPARVCQNARSRVPGRDAGGTRDAGGARKPMHHGAARLARSVN